MKKFLSLFAAVLFAGSMFAETTSVTYAQSSTSAAAVSTGTAPNGSSVTFSTTYTNKNQLTAGNSMTLTLSGYNGYIIKSISLSMKSNSSKGAGSFSAVAGSTTISSIATADFDDDTWNGAYSTTYVNVTPAMTNAAYVIKDEENVVLTIAATVNSLYCQSFTIEYEEYVEPGVVKTLKSIALSDMTTEFETVDKFVFDGKVTATYSVVKEDVPQDDEVKVVLPTSVSTPDMKTAGEKEVTVSFTDGEITKEAKYTITVTEHDVTPGTYEAALNNTFFGTEASAQVAAEVVYKDITFAIDNASGYKPRIDAGFVRFYAGSTLTLSVYDGYVITAVVFAEPEASADRTWNGDITVSVGKYDKDEKSWAGKARELVFSFGQQNRIAKATVTFEVGEPTAVDNTNAEVKAEKFFRNGQLIIRKNGVEYNALGTQL